MVYPPFLSTGSDKPTPISILGSDLSFWLASTMGVFNRAGGPSTDTDDVKDWVDSGPNAQDFTQAIEASQATFAANILNGYPGILFDGTDDYMKRASAFLTGESGAIFIVSQLVVAGGTDRAFYFGSSAEDSVLQYSQVFVHDHNNSREALQYMRINIGDASTLVVLATDTTIVADVPYIHVWRSTGTASKIRINGNEETIDLGGSTVDGDWFADVEDPVNVTLGAKEDTGISVPSNTYIFEVVGVDGVDLSLAKIEELERYFADKYGVVI